MQNVKSNNLIKILSDFSAKNDEFDELINIFDCIRRKTMYEIKAANLLSSLVRIKAIFKINSKKSS